MRRASYWQACAASASWAHCNRHAWLRVAALRRCMPVCLAPSHRPPDRKPRDISGASAADDRVTMSSMFPERRAGRRDRAASSWWSTICPPILRLLAYPARRQGYQVLTAPTASRRQESPARELPDLVLVRCADAAFDGFDLCRALKAAPETRLTPVVLMTGAAEADDRLRAIEAGANDIVNKPIDQPELNARVRSLMELKRYHRRPGLGRSRAPQPCADDRSARCLHEGHCERLSALRGRGGARLRLSRTTCPRWAGAGISRHRPADRRAHLILLKPDRLPRTEYERMKAAHRDWRSAVRRSSRAAPVRPIVRHHHELLDGSGYPDHCPATTFRCSPRSSASWTSTTRSRRRVPIRRHDHRQSRSRCCSSRPRAARAGVTWSRHSWPAAVRCRRADDADAKAICRLPVAAETARRARVHAQAVGSRIE